MKKIKSALILEGGGDRGIFTSGVLDCFLDNNINFPLVEAVSAGAYNAVSFLAHQKGRQKKVYIDLNTKYQYTSWKMRLMKGNFLNDKLVFEDIPNKYIPFDYETFFKSKSICEIAVTNCITGKANFYSERTSRQHLTDLMRATGRLPFLSPVFNFNNKPCLDGGISDSIPLQRALDLGYNIKPVVVLTQDKDYRKAKNEFKFAKIYYHKYPEIYKALAERYIKYNQEVKWIQQLEKEQAVIVIRPEKKIKLARLNNSREDLLKVYNCGYQAAQNKIEEIIT